MAKYKLPEFNTNLSSGYKPRYSSSMQSGLFGQPSEPFSARQSNLFGQEPVEQIVSENDKKIADLQRQVQNLETRLSEAGGEKIDTRNFVEKALNLPEGQVWWQDAFDMLDRSVRAVKEGVTAGSFEVAWEAIKGNRPNPFQEGYIEGSAFAVNTLGIATQEQIDANPTYKLFLDIAVDILADPLTYIHPISILRKIGILSDIKIVSKMEDAIKVARKQGLLELSDDAIKAASKTGRQAAQEALQQAGKNADEIAEILAKPLSQWDDVARVAYDDALKAAGIYDNEGFRRFLQSVDQTIDDQGRIVFTGSKKATAKANTIYKKYLATGATAATVEAAYTGAVRKATTASRKAAIASSKVTELTQRLQDIGLTEAKRAQLTRQLAKQQDIVLTQARISNTYNGIVKEFDDLKALYNLDDFKNIRPGELDELEVVEKMRDFLQQKAKATFGDDVVVVAGDTRSTAADLTIYHRTQDGTYVQLKTRQGTPFRFEVKDPDRFSLLNSNLQTVSRNSLDELKNAAKDALRVHGKDSPEYAEAYAKYLEDAQIYRAAGGQPTFKLSDQGEIVRKYGRDTYNKLNKELQKVLKEVGEGKYTMTEYFDYLNRYYNKYDELRQLHPNWTGKRLAKEAKVVYNGAPEGLAQTITMRAGGEIVDNVGRAMTELTEMVNPKNAYGMIRKLADGTEELVILQPDDFFKSLSLQELSIQSVARSTGTKQSKIATYMQVDFDKLDDVTMNNSWFIDELRGTEAIMEPVLRQTQEYRAGLIVRMLNGVTRTNIPFIAPAADLIAKAVDGFTFLFNSTKGLPDDLTEFLAKVPAEDLQAAKISVAKVNNLVDDMIKATKGRYSEDFVRATVNDLLEAGWDGVTLAGRRMQVSEIMQRWVQQYSKAGKAQFVAFATESEFRNFVTNISDVLAREGLDPNLIKFRQIDGATIVEFAEGTTVKELDEILQNLSPTNAQRMIDLGKGNLTSQQLAFAKEFNEPIQKIVQESVAQQNLLRELGFDFAEGTLGTGAYFRHAINPRMLQFLKNKSPASIKKFLDAGTDMLRDRIYIGSTSEINKAVREMFNINIDLFSTDAAYNFADLVRVASTKNEMSLVLKELLESQDTLGRELFEVVDDLETTARGLRNNFQIINNSFKAEFPNLFKNVSPQTQEMLLKYFADKGFAEGSKVIAIQKSAYGVLKRLDNAYVVLPEFIKNYDQFMRFWKTFALITPGYHMRNFFGNIANSFIAGMPMAAQSTYMFRTSSDFTNYNKVLRMLSNGEDISRLPKRVTDAFKRVDDYFRSGASQSHKGVRDLEIIKEGIRTAKGQTRGPIKKLGDALLNINYSLAERMDDYQRYALYRWAYDNSSSAAAVRSARKAGASLNEIEILRRREAYKKVSEALFDYSHLTPFEKEYMKRLFPFYTFFKNNLIFQAKSLFERPQQFSKLYRSYYYYTESMTGMDIEDLPNYMTDNLWIPMPYRVESNDAEAIEWLRANLPTSDFMDFVQNPFARGVQSITVPIKFAIELGTNRDVFTGRQIKEFPGERSIYEGEGFAASLRNSQGQFTLSQDPYIIKFLNDIGFRSMFNYGTAAIDLIDYRQGNITREDLVQKVADSLGLTRVQELSDLEIASLYQNLDRMRDLKSLYEQENGKLPSLSELAAMAQQEQQQTTLKDLFPRR